jgi:hypothetical protein
MEFFRSEGAMALVLLSMPVASDVRLVVCRPVRRRGDSVSHEEVIA